MDGIDRKILRVMQAHPDLAIVEVAKKAGLSHTPCWRRIKKMEESGVIKGRTIILDADLLGLHVTAYAAIRLKQHDEATLEAFEAMVRQHDEIVECFSVSGESDYMLRILIGSIGDYERFLKKVLLHLPGVGSVNSVFALGRVKMTTALPIP